jgi:hypothetical protein
VLHGALRTIERYAPVIVMESGASSDAMSGNPDNEAMIGKLLDGLGFHEFPLDNNNKYFLHSRSRLLERHSLSLLYARVHMSTMLDISVAISGPLARDLESVSVAISIDPAVAEEQSMYKEQSMYVLPVPLHRRDGSAHPRPNELFVEKQRVSLYNMTLAGAAHRREACSLATRHVDVTIHSFLEVPIHTAGRYPQPVASAPGSALSARALAGYHVLAHATRVVRGVNVAVCVAQK